MWRKALVIGLVVGFGWTASTKDAKHNIIHWNEIQKIVASQNARPLLPHSTRPQVNPNFPPSTNSIAFWDFETGDQGWTAVDGNGDDFTWVVGTTTDLYGNDPPNYGTQYAFYSDDDAGSDSPAANEWWISPKTYITGQTLLVLNFSWGIRYYRGLLGLDEEFSVLVSFDGGNTWYTVWTETSGENGNGAESIDLSSYLPQDSILVAALYTDGGEWNWAAAIDNVELTTTITPEPDEAGDSLRTPSQTVEADVGFNVTVYFSNQGNVDNTFNVYLDIYDAFTNALVASYSAGPYTDNVGGNISHTFSVSGLSKGFYWLYAYHDLSDDVNPTNDTIKWHVLALNHPGTQVIVLDVDPALYNPSVTGGGVSGQSGLQTALAMDDLGYLVEWRFMDLSDFSAYDVAWVTHGVYGNLEQLPTSFVNAMQTFLYNSGRAYAEGGDIWGWSGAWEGGSTDREAWCELFGIDYANVDDGSSDLDSIRGVTNSIVPAVEGHTWQNLGENSFMDRLATLPDPWVEVIFTNPDVGYNAGVGNNYPLGPGLRYHTVATNFELAFMDRTSLDVMDYNLLERILRQGLHTNPTAVAETSPTYPLPTLKVNGTNIVFTLPKAMEVDLRLYDRTGRLVKTVASGVYNSGTHTISLEGINTPSGIYIARMVTDAKTYSAPVVILNQTR